MTPTTELQLSRCLKVCFAALSLFSAVAQSKPLYRCPGPPVIYTDTITVQEARTQGCRSIESRWFEVGSGSETTVYADTQSMRRNGPKVKVWLKWVYAKALETKSYPKKNYLSEKALAIYHCADRTSTTIQVIRYVDTDVSGEVVESASILEANVDYHDVAPETIGESILDYVCSPNAINKK